MNKFIVSKQTKLKIRRLKKFGSEQKASEWIGKQKDKKAVFRGDYSIVKIS